jgi:hypothetical protein
MKKDIKDLQIGKEEVKLSLLSNDMVLHRIYPKIHSPKLFETINKFSSIKLQDTETTQKNSILNINTNPKRKLRKLSHL